MPCGASDPGGNTFQTVISIDGAVVKLGEGLTDHVLDNFGRAIDALESRIKDPTLGPWQRSAMAKRIKRLHRRARNAVKQAAHEYALLIACRFKVLFLPHFRVSEMVEGSPLGRTVSRKLMAIGHAEFGRLLMEKAAVHGCRVVFVRGMLVCLLFHCAIGYVCTLVTTAMCAADRRGVDDEDLLQLRAREPRCRCSLRVLLPPLWPHRGSRHTGGQEHPGTRSQRTAGARSRPVQTVHSRDESSRWC